MGKYRPSLNKHSISSKVIHDLISNCWDHNPHNRPTMKTVVNVLRVETVFLTNNGSSRRSDDIVSSCIMTSRSSGRVSSSSSSLCRGFGLFGSQSSFDSTNTNTSSPSSSFSFPLIKRKSTAAMSKTTTTPTTKSSYISAYKSYGSMKSLTNKMQRGRKNNNGRANFVWNTNPQQQQTTTTPPNDSQQPQQKELKKMPSTSSDSNNNKMLPTTTMPATPKLRASLLYSSVFGKVGNKDCLRRRSSLSSLSSFPGKNLLAGSASVASSSSSSQNLYTIE